MRQRLLQSGFTILEALITTVVIAIMAGFAAPTMGRWLDDTRHRTLVSSYHQTFSYARWQAVTQRHVVTICPLSELGRCIDDWSREVSVFPDADTDQTPDSGIIWRVVSPPPAQFVVTSRTGGRGYIQLAPSGLAHGPAASLMICPKTSTSGGRMSYLAMNRGGRFRAEHAAPGKRRMTLSWGAKLSC